MATNKTIQPTNVTVQIPAMADVPDASVFSNAIDKSIDGINTLNSHTVYLSHYNGNNVTIVLPNYSTALCTALVSGVGSSAFAIYRSGNSITFHHIAGHDAVTNSLSATVASSTSATISTTGTNIQLTTVLSNLA